MIRNGIANTDIEKNVANRTYGITKRLLDRPFLLVIIITKRTIDYFLNAQLGDDSFFDSSAVNDFQRRIDFFFLRFLQQHRLAGSRGWVECHTLATLSLIHI